MSNANPSGITAVDVRMHVDDPNKVYRVHRHCGILHAQDGPCWCEPLEITGMQVVSYRISELQSVLDAHFAVQ